MDKNAIKNFAVWARKKLIEDIKQKAYEIGITEKEIKEPVIASSDTMIIGDRSLNKVEIGQRKSLIARIKEKGFDSVMEEVAYTWFNRILALRFMEVNGYLPSGVRVLSSAEPGRKDPDIIREALNTGLDLDSGLVYRLQDDNDIETLYRYLLVKQCNALNEILPGLFEEISDYTEILLPSNLLAEGSVIRQLTESIPEEDFRDQVEIIGWMYQYYISGKKDEVFEGLKKNVKITKENIPAATQLFTPGWIVKYMVENSLGRLWLEGHPNEELKSRWEYYIDEAEQEGEVRKQLEEIRAESREIRPEDIKVLDPAMGSGHILVYAFEVLYDIYKSEGYSERDIPVLILENNLYGLEIDDRAAQLAYFALMMKARSKSRRIFREKVNVNICAIQESNDLPGEAAGYPANPGETGNPVQTEDIEYLINIFHDAKEYGSILEVKPVDFEAVERSLGELGSKEAENFFAYTRRNEILDKMPHLIKQAKIMSQKYDVVVTNPPYMGGKGMNIKLANYAAKNYPDSRGDLYAVFMELGRAYLKRYVYMAMINQQSWMFLTSYNALREKIINSNTIINMMHLGPHAFEEIGGEVVQTSAFVLGNYSLPGYAGYYIRLVDIDSPRQKETEALRSIHEKKCYKTSGKTFLSIPGRTIAYWVSPRTVEILSGSCLLSSIAEARKGLITSDNQRFLRLWHEVDINRIGFNMKNSTMATNSGRKWFPYIKGGAYRKWYGNYEYVVNYENDGEELKEWIKELTKDKPGGRIINKEYYFRKGITWSSIGTKKTSFRFVGEGSIYSNTGMGIFSGKYNLYTLTGFLNSKVAGYLLQIISPTMGFEAIYISRMPVLLNPGMQVNDTVVDLVKQNIAAAKTDWDSFETSWDFKKHPLLACKGSSTTVEQAFGNWWFFAEKQFNRLKANERELNRIFIGIYGLQDELDPEVGDNDITIRKADRVRDIKSFISYAVGCMFGRYSIDAEGLIFAGGDFNDKWKYENGGWKVRKTVKDEEGKVIEDAWINASFAPDMDNILPITDEEYFENDIVTRFVEFLKATFGGDTLEENLDYIAGALGRKPSETARQAVRRYFLKEFYKDHVHVYRKRPIYWMFDSGKQDGFKALVYMHRYDEYTVARVRTDYLHKLQKSYEAEVKKLDVIIDSNASQREKANARKKKEHILRQMEECLQYDQAIAHVANRRIRIDPDDGVKVNHARFQGIEIPRGEGKKPLKMDLLAGF